MAITDCGMGLMSFLIGATTVIGEGSCGCSGDIAFGKAVGYPAPFDAKLTNKQYYVKGTAQEINAALLNLIWDEVAVGTAMGASTHSVDPSAVTVVVTLPVGTFTLTGGVAADFGEISSGESDTTGVAFTFQGVAAGTTPFKQASFSD